MTEFPQSKHPFSKKERIWLIATLLVVGLSLRIGAEFVENGPVFYFGSFAVLVALLITYKKIRMAHIIDKNGGINPYEVYEKDISKQPKLVRPAGQNPSSFGLGGIIIFGSLFVISNVVYPYQYNSILNAMDSQDHAYLNQVYSNAENILSLMAPVHFILVILFGIAILRAYHHCKKTVESYGVTGLPYSTLLLAAFMIAPLLNLLMPWITLGALDRATRFAADNQCAGDLWTRKEHRGLSVIALVMGVLSLAVIAIGAYQVASARTPFDTSSVSEWRAYLNQAVLLSSVFAALSFAYVVSLYSCFSSVGRNLQRIAAIAESP